MEWVVTTAKSVDEAKDAALDELGVDEADAEFEVLEEPRQGLFGRQRGEARVRARVRPTAPRPKVERRDRKRRTKADGGSDESREVTPSSEVAGGATAARPAARVAAKSVRGTSSAGPRRRSGSAGGSPSPAGVVGESAPTPVRANARTPRNTDERETDTVIDEELSLQEQGALAQQFLIGLVDRFAAVADVTVLELDEDTVEVRVAGNDLGLMVGNKGQTLAAVQELTRTVVQRHTPGRTGRLMVDVAGYRQRRREALERFTRQVADDVVSSGAPKVLEAMSAADRKVVHDTANDIEGVRTISEGEDPHRRVVLLPDVSA